MEKRSGKEKVSICQELLGGIALGQIWFSRSDLKPKTKRPRKPIDLWPEGGEVVAVGRPEDIAESKESLTGKFLREWRGSGVVEPFLFNRQPEESTDSLTVSRGSGEPEI